MSESSSILYSDAIVSDVILSNRFEESKETALALIVLPNFEQPAIVHILCAATIISLTLVGNAFVIYIYSKKKPIRMGYIFILTIAALDIFAALTITPQFTFIKYYLIMLGRYGDSRPRDQFLTLLIFVETFYLALLDCMAVNRVLAVFSPYTYKQSRGRTVAMITTAAVASLLLAATLPQIDKRNSEPIIMRVTVSLIPIASFALMACTNIAVIFKLRKTKQQVFSTSGKSASSRNETDLTSKDCLQSPTFLSKSRLR